MDSLYIFCNQSTAFYHTNLILGFFIPEVLLDSLKIQVRVVGAHHSYTQ